MELYITNLLSEIMVSSYCIVFRGVHKYKTVTALNINHGLYFSNLGSFKNSNKTTPEARFRPGLHRLGFSVV